MKKIFLLLISVLIIILLLVIYELNSNKLKSEFVEIGTNDTRLIEIKSFASERKPKNIILIVGDGVGLNQIAISRIAIGGPDYKLAIDQMPYTGFSLTHSANNLYTDSAAAATTWATGVKTSNKFLSMTPDKEIVKTIPELLSDRGFLSGVVATSSVTHATPAAFYAHVDSRYKEEEIAKQLIDSPIAISLGGGLEFFDLDDLKNKTTFVNDKKDLFNKKLISSKRIIGLFDDDGIVRSDQKPTQQEMTKIAVNFLSSNTKACSGFFLMSEGSQIDWYGHSNDVTKMIIEFEDFDETIRDTMNFVSEDEDTLLIVTADHETGGLQIMGNENNQTKIQWGTGSHTGTPVGVYAYGPGANLFSGLMDNTEIHNKILEVINFKELDSSSCSN